MREFYTVMQKTVTIGHFPNVDEAEITAVLTGNGCVVCPQNMKAEFEQGSLACYYEDNGEFYIQNEDCERICTIDVTIEAIDCLEWVNLDIKH